MQLDALVAEDEPLLRQALAAQLQRLWPELRIVAECEDGAAALEALETYKPDLAFLDIRMPGVTGIDVARALETLSPQTQVVFVTAYDQYAIDAFERGAADYLLKPVSDERLLATRQRLLARLSAGRPDRQLLGQLLEQLARRPVEAAATPPLAWITASNGRETRLVMLEDVLYFRADSKYTAVVTADEELLHAATGVSGSAPAYLYAFVEALEAAGAAAGLPSEDASRLARSTITGAAALLARSGEEPAELRKQVTSPGGTTQAALEVLLGQGGLPDLLRDAVAAAARRSKELGG